VEDAQQAIDAACKQHEHERWELAARDRELARERRAMKARKASELRRMKERLDAVSKEYEKRLAAWQRALGQLSGA
jgi:hypothetical protein